FFIISLIAVQTPGSGISNLLVVETTFTSSGNLYCKCVDVVEKAAEMGEVVVQVVAGNKVNKYSNFECGRDRDECLVYL
nr:hypothetical protein [Tanacetum cinerariifolium]